MVTSSSHETCKIYTTATGPIAHLFSLIFQILRDQQGILLIPSAIRHGKEALIYPLYLSICFLDITYDFCYVLHLVIVLLCICFVLQFSMLLCQAVLCLNISTVYYLFNQSWQDEYFFFKFSNVSQTLPVSLKQTFWTVRIWWEQNTFFPFLLMKLFSTYPEAAVK